MLKYLENDKYFRVILLMTELMQIAIEKIDQTGSVVKRKLICFKEINQPKKIEDLGLRHSEQINILQEIQDEIIELQSEYLHNTVNYCPRCGSKLIKRGYTKSDFNAVFTDHKVPCSRKVCGTCKWKSIPSISSIFGTHIHPDLSKLQLEMSSNYPYRSAQKILNSMVNKNRKTNNHYGLKKLTETVSKYIDTHPVDTNINIIPADELVLQVDGGHLKTTEDKRSIEAMTSVVYNPVNIKHMGGNEKKDGAISELRGKITSKNCAASALSDNQESIKMQTLRAAKLQGMTTKTKITALCDGASNCWSVVDSLTGKCDSIDRILDWFHIAMKFKNTGLNNKDLNKRLESAKWNLWHGKVSECLEILSLLCEDLKADIKRLNKVTKLKLYIENNKCFVTQYSERKHNNLIFTSHLAEATVESLINQRCKNKQHMRWSREGLHAILVVRAAVNSDQWLSYWNKYTTETFKRAA